MIDQSFPRDDNELRLVAISLGELEKHIAANDAHLVVTNILKDIVDNFDWSKPRGLLFDIYTLLKHWLLQPHERLITLNLDSVTSYSPHPVPDGINGQGLVEFWADEMGRMLSAHDVATEPRCFFIGIACDSAFSGNAKRCYSGGPARVFPCIGPNDIGTLVDSYQYIYSSDLHQKTVTFDDACKNIHLLGAKEITAPSGGSHYKVVFDGRRPWELDRNVNHVPERFLKELVPITGCTIDYIKYVLIYGKLPPKRFRLEEWIRK